MEKKIEIRFPTDEYGLIGRECHNCNWYFKVKLGTGLPTTDCICPYCGHMDSSDKFITTEQEEYVKSNVAREVLGPVKHYNERDLETQVTCDCCGLEFAGYGVFADCPDCGRLNALTILNKSMEVESKKLKFLENLESSETALIEAVLSDVLSGGVSASPLFYSSSWKVSSTVIPKTREIR